jgi:5,10-methylenetetrahydrofolate reductase
MGKVSFNVKEAISKLEYALKDASSKEAVEISEQLESLKNLEKEGIKEIHLYDGE